MKDRIGNVLAKMDKVLVELPSTSIFGFIADLQEPGVVAIRRGTAAETVPGRILVSCVIALPVDAAQNAVMQLVKVYDADKKGTQGPSLVAEGSSEPSKAN
jgi:hypothetical protein